jgi:hypothetical protein
MAELSRWVRLLLPPSAQLLLLASEFSPAPLLARVEAALRCVEDGGDMRDEDAAAVE